MENYKPCKLEITASGQKMPTSLRTGKPHWDECQDAQVAQAKQKKQRAGLTAEECKRLSIGKHKPDQPGQLKLFGENKERRAGLTAEERKRLSIGKHKPDQPRQLKLFGEDIAK